MMTPTAPRAIENMVLSMLAAAPLGAEVAAAPALAPDPEAPLAEAPAPPDLEAEADEPPAALLLPEVEAAPLARDCEVDPTEAVAIPEPDMMTGADSTA